MDCEAEEIVQVTDSEVQLVCVCVWLREGLFICRVVWWWDYGVYGL